MAQQVIALDLVDPNPYQPRTTDDPEHIQNLALSIARDGLLQPPAARQVDGRYQLAFGHSRYKAISFLYVTLETDPHWFDNHGLNREQDFSMMPLEVVTLDNEQMYRHAVSENMQRKDLTPIEEAHAMKRAQDEFGYTSAQVGMLFGRNESTVRGKVRLLDLPEAVQARLSKGELSEGTARTLLTVSRVLGAEKIDILAGKVADYKNPEEVMEQTHRELLGVKDTVQMFNGRWNSGEPRAGEGLWPLTWTFEEFPTGKQAIKGWKGPKTIKRFASGAPYTEPISEVFEQIAALIRSNHQPRTWEQVKEIRPEWADAVDHLRRLANPPACTQCPVYVKLDGIHVCGAKACWKRKREVWIEQQFQAYVAEIGIPILAENESHITPEWSEREKYAKLLDKRDPALRLVKRFNDYNSWDITGSKFAVLVDTSEKRIKARQEKEVRDTAQDKWKRDQMMRDAGNKFIAEHAVHLFAQAFDKFANVGAMMALTSTSDDRDVDGRKFSQLSREEKLTILRKRLAALALSNSLNWKLMEQGPSAVAEHLKGLALTCGVNLSENWLDIARSYEPFGTPTAPVSVETAQPEVEAVA